MARARRWLPRARAREGGPPPSRLSAFSLLSLSRQLPSRYPMRNKLVIAAVAMAAALTSTYAIEREASACGGCFTPPENPTVVTDHRMILTIAKEQSTLYDQIKYSGNPAAFA